MTRLANETAVQSFGARALRCYDAMDTRATPDVSPAAARRALIGLVADIAWAVRGGAVAQTQRQAREEALSLLARIDHGDRDAARRAMELVGAAHDHAA
jgi:hypothetical protein